MTPYPRIMEVAVAHQCLLFHSLATNEIQTEISFGEWDGKNQQ